jgi:hypothetical protein
LYFSVNISAKVNPEAFDESEEFPAPITVLFATYCNGDGDDLLLLIVFYSSFDIITFSSAVYLAALLYFSCLVSLFSEIKSLT